MRGVAALSRQDARNCTESNVIIQCQRGNPAKSPLQFPRRLAQVGEWLSLVEHLVRDQGVGGSNPLSPTNILKYLNCASDSSVWMYPSVRTNCTQSVRS